MTTQPPGTQALAIAAAGQRGRHRRDTAARGRRVAVAAAGTAAAALVAGGITLTTHSTYSTTSAVPAPPAAHPFTVAPADVPALARRAAEGSSTTVKNRSGGSRSTVAQHVYVPSLSIDAGWVGAGFSFATGLAVPADVHTIGLSAQGGQPGQSTGTVLMAGHVNYAGQGAGSFETLTRIRPGADVIVTGTAGQRSRWVVVSLASVPKSELPRSLFTATGPRRLVLVTCGGPLHNGNYDDNIVVTAIPVPTAPVATSSSPARFRTSASDATSSTTLAGAR